VLFPLLAFFLAYVVVNWPQFCQPYDPVGDSAVNALQVERARHFQEYLGAYSRYGFHHPGPLAFYYTAWAEGLLCFLPCGQVFLARVLLHFLFLLLCLHIVYRSFHPGWQVLLFLVAILFTLYALGNWVFFMDWAPAQIILPVVAFILSAANLACGKTRYVLPLVLAGTFVGQTHVGGLVLVLPLGLLALLLYGVGQIVRRTHLERTDKVFLMAAAMFLVLSMLPPLYEQLTSPYGNMSRLYDFYVRGRVPPYYVAGQEKTHTLAEGWNLVLSFYTDPLAGVVGNGPSYLFLAVLFVAGLLQLRLRREAIHYLLLFLLAGLALSVWAASRITGELFKYLLWFEYGLVALWIFLLLKGIAHGLGFLWARAGRLWPRFHLPRLLHFLAILAATIPAVLMAYRVTLGRSQAVAVFTAAVDPQPGRTYFIWWNKGSRSHDQWALAAGLAYRWTKAGSRVCLAEPWWEFMFGQDLVCPTLPDDTYPVFLSARREDTTASYEKMVYYETTVLEAGYPTLPFTLRASAGETFFWGWTEPKEGQRWAEEISPKVYFFLPHSAVSTESLEMVFSCAGPAGQKVSVQVNGRAAGEIALATDGPATFHILVPFHLLRENAINEVAFVLPGAPGQAGTSLAFRELKLQSPPPSPPLVQQGENWYAPEESAGLRYQWISNDAVLRLFAPREGWYRLSFRAHSFRDYRHLRLLLGDTAVGEYTVGHPAFWATPPFFLPRGWSDLVLHVEEG